MSGEFAGPLVPAREKPSRGRHAEIRVATIGFAPFTKGRKPEELLQSWPMLTEIPSSLRRFGVHVDVLHTSWRTAVLEHRGIRCHFVAERWPPRLRLPAGPSLPLPPRRLAQLARSLAPDVVHVNGLVFPMQVRYLASVLRGVPILAEQRAMPRIRGWRRRVYRWGLAPIEGVAFTTREQAQYYFDVGVFRPGLPVFEVLGGSTRFTPGDRSAARVRSGLYGEPALLWVGRLNENKDPLAVLEAFRQAIPELPNPHLWLCFSDAPLLEPVVERVEQDPVLRSRVHLLGFRPRPLLQEFYRAADLFILGSHYESTGFAPIEALACGTPVALTDIPSFRRITGDGRVGALSQPGDVAAMARAIIEWSRRNGAASRHRAREHFERALSYDVLCGQLRAAYVAVRSAGQAHGAPAGRRGAAGTP